MAMVEEKDEAIAAEPKAEATISTDGTEIKTEGEVQFAPGVEEKLAQMDKDEANVFIAATGGDKEPAPALESAPAPEKEQTFGEMIGNAVKGFADAVSDFVNDMKGATSDFKESARDTVENTGVDAAVMQKFGAGQGISADLLPENAFDDIKDLLKGNDVSQGQEVGAEAKVAAHAPAQQSQEEGLGR